MADFTIRRYKKLLTALKENNYLFLKVEDFVQNPVERCVILRNDVDLKPKHALRIAKIQNELGIYSTFYFRINAPSYNVKIINQIVALGHEIGYHYEDIDLAYAAITREKPGAPVNDDILTDRAWKSFNSNLEKLRRFYPVKTICMHGSPLSKYNNRMVWAKYNYRDAGIICEPYRDIDFNTVAYFTDTGRRWNGSAVNRRDKVKSSFNFNYRSTSDIIRNVKSLPDRVMITVHPQRWNTGPFAWLTELIYQNLKNIVKAFLKSPVQA